MNHFNTSRQLFIAARDQLRTVALGAGPHAGSAKRALDALDGRAHKPKKRGLPPDQNRALAMRMGLVASAPTIKSSAYKLQLGVLVPVSEASSNAARSESARDHDEALSLPHAEKIALRRAMGLNDGGDRLADHRATAVTETPHKLTLGG
jgi:hypothetical protein